MESTTQRASSSVLLWIVAVALQIAYYHIKHVINECKFSRADRPQIRFFFLNGGVGVED